MDGRERPFSDDRPNCLAKFALILEPLVQYAGWAIVFELDTVLSTVGRMIVCLGLLGECGSVRLRSNSTKKTARVNAAKTDKRPAKEAFQGFWNGGLSRRPPR